MESHVHTPELERLLSHSEWLRSLARRLVADAAAADDLVQETWLAALKNPPDPDRPARPWLAGVLRNLARLRARTEGRRHRRQKAVAQRDELPSTAELVERVDTGRRLASVVLELSEPYRTTVLLRYHHELSAAEIARRQGVPAGTVRWRLKRGLEELRTRLDSSFENRRAWCLAFVELGRSGGSASGIGALTSATFATALFAGVVALFGVLFWFTRGDAALAVETESPLLLEVALDEGARGAMEPLAADVGDERASALEETPVASAPLLIRVAREDGAPLAGIDTVLVDGNGGAEREATGADGRVAFEAQDGTGRLFVKPPGSFLQVTEVALSSGERTAVFPIGRELSGRVRVDGRAPDPPMELTLTLDQPLFDEELPAPVRAAFTSGRRASVLTGPDGTFRFDGLRDNWSGLLLMPRGYTVVGRPSRPFTGPELRLDGPTSGLTVDLTTRPTLTGRVVEPEGALPVAGAEVRCALVRKGRRARVFRGTADEGGAFGIGLDADDFVSAEITFSAPGGRGRRTASFLREELVPALAVGDLELLRGTRLEFLAVGPGGAPIPGAVATTGESRVHSEPAGLDGRGVLEVVEGDAGPLLVDAPGHLTGEAELDGSDLLVVTLLPSNRFTLDVRTPSDTPFARAELLLTCAEPLFVETGAWSPPELPRRVRPGSLVRTLEQSAVFLTNEDGRLVVEGLVAETPIKLTVVDPLGQIVHEEVLAPFARTERRTRQLTIREPLHTLRGRAVDEAGDPLVGIIIRATIDDAPGTRTRTDALGLYSFENLSGDRVHIEVEKPGFAKTRIEDHPLASGEELEILVVPGHDFVVHVTDGNENPVANATVEARFPGQPLTWRAKEIAPGAYELTDLPAETVHVTVAFAGRVYERDHDALVPELSVEVGR